MSGREYRAGMRVRFGKPPAEWDVVAVEFTDRGPILSLCGVNSPNPGAEEVRVFEREVEFLPDSEAR